MSLSTSSPPPTAPPDVDPESAALFRIGVALASELDLDRLVQRLTDEATGAVHARFGAFFYNVTSSAGEGYALQALSGAPRAAFDGFGMPRNTALFGATFRAEAVVRIDDVRADPRFGQSSPHQGLPAGHPPVVSYLAVPVVARGSSGEVLGGLFFGHPEPARFTAREERLAIAVASQVAVAIENARLFRDLERSRAEEANRARRASIAGEIGSLWTRGGPLAATLRGCASVLARDEAIGVVRIWVADGDELHLRASVGCGEPDDRTGRTRPGEGPIGRVAAERTMLALTDASDEALPALADPSLRALGALPLEADGALVGVLAIRAREPIPDAVLESLRPIASLLALGIRRAQEQARLRTSEVKHRLVAEASNEGIWFWDVATNTVEWNDRLLAMLGLERAQWGGGLQDWLERVHPDDRAMMRAALDAHLTRREPYDVPRFRLRHASGEHRLCSTRGQAEWDEHGAPVHMAGAVVDSARLYAQAQRDRERAEHANRTKDEFLAVVSHELRTPLNAISGWAKMLRSGVLPQEKHARAMEVIERNAQIQTQLIDDLLDVSRIVSGKLRLAATQIAIRDVIEIAVEGLRPQADAKRLALVTELDADTACVHGDPDRLQQVVWNLVSNAVKFTPPEGRIVVTLRVVGGDAEIRVTDSGAGIRADFLPHVFDRFRQSDSGKTRAHGGLGLGLTIVRHIVELHGGRIEARSEGEGRGATFVVRIPSVAVTGGARAVVAITRPSLAPTLQDVPRLDGVRVLIVDDEVDARELLVSAFQDLDASVTPVSSAAEALSALDVATPDVLISDIGMPGADGYALIRRVRALAPDRGGRLPAIALTAYSAPEDRARALEEGFDRHLTKPVEPSELAMLIAELTGRATLAER